MSSTRYTNLLVKIFIATFLVLPLTANAHTKCKVGAFGQWTEGCPHMHAPKESQSHTGPMTGSSNTGASSKKKKFKAVAIAWNSNGRSSWATRDTVSSAKQAALDYCNKNYGNCKLANVIVEPTAYGCVAVAQSGTALYAATRSNGGESKAKEAALNSCKKNRSNCKIAISKCNYSLSWGKKKPKPTAKGSSSTSRACSSSAGCTMTLSAQNDTGQKAHYHYFIDGVTARNGYVFTLYPGATATEKIQCRANQKICIGGWIPRGRDLGVGANGKDKCNNCCTSCTGGKYRFKPLGQLTSSASTTPVQVPAPKNTEGFDFDYGKNYENNSNKTSSGSSPSKSPSTKNEIRKPTLKYTFANNSGQAVLLDIYNQTTNEKNSFGYLNPGDQLGTKIECNRKDRICYGAYVDEKDKYWGVGRGNKKCRNCCVYCDGRSHHFELNNDNVIASKNDTKSHRSNGRMGITVENKTDRDMNIDIMVSKNRSKAQKTDVNLNGVSKVFVECKDDDQICIGAYHDDSDNLFEWGMGKEASQCLINSKCCVRCTKDSHKFVIDSYAIN